MDTIGSARAWAAQKLKLAGVESATLTADLLLGHVVGWDRVRLLSRPEVALRAEAMERLKELVQRRLQGEPLQYLTGEQEFYGLRFRVTPAVLIPRPETEILVEKAVSLAECRSGQPVRFADVGTGSGCIAVAFAHQVPGSLGSAVDVSIPALAIARENATRHGVLDRILFLCCDLMTGFPPGPLFDFILSNPPYVARTEYNTMPGTVREHEPHLALFAGESGLDVFRRLIPQAAERLVPGGYLLVEVGIEQAAAVKQIVLEEKIAVESLVNDLQGIPRCIVARKRVGPGCQTGPSSLSGGA
jgi:release factor glutamine methyltransferase